MSGLNPFGTSPISFMWQGFVSDVPAFFTRAVYGGTFERTAIGVFVINGSPIKYSDQDTIAQVYISENGSDAVTFDQIICLYVGGEITIGFKHSGSATDPSGLFSVVLFDATDGVSNIEGGPGNP